MPVAVKKIKPGVFKVVEASTGKVTRSSGTFSSEIKAKKTGSSN